MGAEDTSIAWLTKQVHDLMESEDWKDSMVSYRNAWKDPGTEFHLASNTCLMINSGVPRDRAIYFTMVITHDLHRDLADGG